jgi:RimJ/RimL family protein N-acetyltransferase
VSLRLRRAGREDSALILRWRNSAGGRAASFTPGVISKRKHAAWMENKMEDPRCRLIMGVDAKGKPVAHVRLDQITPGKREISITVAPSARGRGIGTLALKATASRAKREGARVLVAHIKPVNIGSTLAFLKAGYLFVRIEKMRGLPAYRMEKEL